VARAGDELDAQALDVVVGVVERVDLQLAAVAGAGVDLADRQRLAEDAQQFAWMRSIALARPGVVARGGGSLTMPVRRSASSEICHIRGRAPNS
jgi:hypothetical protein